MESATQSPTQVLINVEAAQNEQGLFSSESVLNILKLIFAGSPLPEVLTIIARLVESLGDVSTISPLLEMFLFGLSPASTRFICSD